MTIVVNTLIHGCTATVRNAGLQARTPYRFHWVVDRQEPVGKGIQAHGWASTQEEAEKALHTVSKALSLVGTEEPSEEQELRTFVGDAIFERVSSMSIDEVRKYLPPARLPGWGGLPVELELSKDFARRQLMLAAREGVIGLGAIEPV